MAAFLGTLVVCESCLLAQWLVSQRTRQQGGSVEPPWSFAYQASLARSLPVAQKEKQEAELAPLRNLKTGYAKKNGCCHFFLTLRPFRENFKHSSRTSLCGFRDRTLGTRSPDVAAVAAT